MSLKQTENFYEQLAEQNEERLEKLSNALAVLKAELAALEPVVKGLEKAQCERCYGWNFKENMKEISSPYGTFYEHQYPCKVLDKIRMELEV